jgi:hypothetical protein
MGVTGNPYHDHNWFEAFPKGKSSDVLFLRKARNFLTLFIDEYKGLEENSGNIGQITTFGVDRWLAIYALIVRVLSLLL